MQIPNTATYTITANRASAVERVRAKWIKSLIDVSRRNNLLFYRDLKRGTLDLTDAPMETLAELLAGSRVRLSDLIFATGAEQITRDLADARKTTLQMQRRAQANLEERGLQTLFIAYGMASWPAPDMLPGDAPVTPTVQASDTPKSGAGAPSAGAKGALQNRPYEAAVVLIPAALDIHARDPRGSTLEIIGNPEINLALLHVLANDYGVVIDPEALLGAANGAPDAAANGAAPEEKDPDLALVLNRLRDAVTKVNAFTVKPRVVLGNFSFQKMAMVSDLQQHADLFAANDVLGALAGDDAARGRMIARRADIDPRQLDKIPADDEFLVLDADSSQQRVIHSVLKLQSGVIQGPPGTGKSQTIVNLIAALVAAGQRVLFVAEKRAALDVVLNRLDRVGLGHLALDLHDTDTNRVAALRRIGKSLDSIGATLPVNIADIHNRFEDRRTRLNAHDAVMHTARPPAARDVYYLQGILLRAPPEYRCAIRWRGSDLERLTPDNVARIKDLLKEASGFAPILRPVGAPAWAAATLSDGHAAQQAIDLVARIARQRLPELQNALYDYAVVSQLRMPNHQSELASVIRFLTRLATLLNGYTADLFDAAPGLTQLAQELAPARNLLSRTVNTIFNASFRNALKTMRGARKTGAASISASQALADVNAALVAQKTWQQYGGDASIPDHVPDFETVLQRYEALNADLLTALPLLAGLLRDHDARPYPALVKLFAELAADSQTPYQLPRANEIRVQINKLGGGEFLNDPTAARSNPNLWPGQFDFAWTASCMDKALAQETHLSGFIGNTYNTFVNDFKDLDRQRVAVAIDRVKRAHAERAIAALNEHADQLHLVQRELEKKRRQMPLRKLLAAAPDVLTAICPCWMASPLSVSQLLASNRKVFDIVLFDEASQVPPEDAAPAIMRATHVVVAGDKHQLPPTRFFASDDAEADEDAEDQLSTEGFESLLDLMNALTGSWWLDWHYRSRDESLIAFSNKHIYADRLITFPSIGGERVLSHVLVQTMHSDIARPTDMTRTRSDPEEAQRVVQMIIEHAQARPRESLGVIALGIRHAQRIQDELDRALPEHPDLDEFFKQDRDEPFFVKNLERVQGDERDAIILSVGYGKDQNGKLPYRFGPLLQEGGERRLNVAVTRARARLTLVSSFSHFDMDPSRTRARGVELLRLYLEYAAGQGSTLSEAQNTAIPLNEFEADVRDALTARGLRLLPQWGVSGYRIDFVAQHPEHPGSFVLAIECDGASYHAAPTARDRDRLRQQQLEALGWSFYRIWSTDWFFRREAEIEKVITSYQQAVERYDQRAAGAPAAPAAKPPAPSVSSALPVTASVAAADPPAPQRKPRPNVPMRKTIADYSDAELISLASWISSDGLLRTQNAMEDEMRDELGFKRRGARIDEAIQRAIEKAGGRA